MATDRILARASQKVVWICPVMWASSYVSLCEVRNSSIHTGCVNLSSYVSLWNKWTAYEMVAVPKHFMWYFCLTPLIKNGSLHFSGILVVTFQIHCGGIPSQNYENRQCPVISGPNWKNTSNTYRISWLKTTFSLCFPPLCLSGAECRHSCIQ